jgi:hypothetical protein
MKTLAVVRAVVFAVLLVYTLYAIPWKYLDLIFFGRQGVLLSSADVLMSIRSVIVAALLSVAWIGLDAWLGFTLLRRAEAGKAPAPATPAAHS